MVSLQCGDSRPRLSLGRRPGFYRFMESKIVELRSTDSRDGCPHIQPGGGRRLEISKGILLLVSPYVDLSAAVHPGIAPIIEDADCIDPEVCPAVNSR